MRHSPKIVQLEFNELSPELIERFMAEGSLPNFERLYESSEIFMSDAGVPVDHLEPWIQWPTVHSGLSHEEHGIFHLGDSKRVEGKTIGEYLSREGYRVGIFGAMNCAYKRVNGYVIPDPWDAEAEPYPADLRRFSSFVARQVQESSRQEDFSVKELATFGAFLARHGLKTSTIARGMRQLLSEKVGPYKWRRAMLFEDLSYDLFRYLNRKHAVDYATFFCNSAAHYQHYYWRDFEPERFSRGAPSRMSGAIRESYRHLDRLLGRAMADYPSSTLIFCTALSQCPWTDTAKCLFRPKDFESLFRFVGLDPEVFRVRPVMAQQFYLDASAVEGLKAAEELFAAVTMDGAPVFWFERKGLSLFGGCQVEAASALGGSVRNRAGETAPFAELFYQIHGVRSGRHDPRGALWIRNHKHRVHEGKIDLRRIAPTILREYRVPPPPHMKGAPLATASAG